MQEKLRSERAHMNEYVACDATKTVYERYLYALARARRFAGAAVCGAHGAAQRGPSNVCGRRARGRDGAVNCEAAVLVGAGEDERRRRAGRVAERETALAELVEGRLPDPIGIKPSC